MANEIVNRKINVFIESGDAQKVYDTLIGKDKKLREELTKTSDPKRIKQLNTELAKLAEPIDRASKKLSGQLEPTLRDTMNAAKRLNAELINMSKSDPEYAKKIDQLKRYNALITAQKSEINGLANGQKGLLNQSPFGRVSEFAKGAFLGGAMLQVIGSFKEFLSDSISEALEAEEITAKFKATLDNLGRSDAFDRIIGKAQEIADKFGYLDNDEVVGVFNKLIDYGKLTEKQMNQLLPVIIDFAAKQRISIGESSDVIFKALEGNGKALKTYGIDLKDAKTETERMNIVMTTLKEKVDGAAEAFGNSAAGNIAKTKQQFADLKEEIGSQLLPVLTTLLGWVNKLLTGFEYLGTKVKEWGQDIAAFFTGGPGAVAELHMKRMEELQTRLKQNIVNDLVNEMTGKSVGEVGEKINELNQRLIQLQGLLQRAKRAGQDAFTPEDVKKYEEGVELLRMQLAALYNLNSGADQKLGISQSEADRVSKDLKKILEDYKKLREELEAMRRSRQGEALSPMEKEVAEMFNKFEQLKKLAHGNRELLKKIDEEYYEQIFQIQLKYGRQEIAEFERQQKEVQQRMEQWLQKLTSLGVQTSTNDRLKGISSLVSDDNAAKRQLEFMKANQARKLQMQQEDLAKERDAEILALENKAATYEASEESIQNSIALIKAHYREKETELIVQHYAKIANQIGSFLQQAFQAVQQIVQLQTDRENAGLQADAERNEKKKHNLENRLKSGLITQLQHDREVQKIERDQDRREKEIKIRQFRRNQRMSAIQATINGFMAVTNALATVQPLWAGIVMAAIVAASTAAQVTAIMAQKPPEYGNGGTFGNGGKTSGRSHSNGGNPIIDGNTGRKMGEIEEDEGIINKRSMRDRKTYQVSGTVSQIASLLNRMHGGVNWEHGAKLVPAWRMAKPAQINVQSVQRYYAAGGVVRGNGSQVGTNNNQQATAQQNVEVNAMMMDTLNGMNQTISAVQNTLDNIQKNGISAYTVLSQHEKQVDRRDAILEDATMKG